MHVHLVLKKNHSRFSQDSFDERERDQRERPESSEWREERNLGQDRQLEVGRRDMPKEERSERPQRPDSRDSRTSRESKTSLRDDDLHKLRDCNSWVSEVSDYEEKKRDLYHEEARERERERERDRDRRQPPGPVTKEKIEADELKSEKRNLTQLKRGSSDQEKKDQPKESSVEVKKDTDAWIRKTERTPESRSIERGDNSPKAWADAISPTFEKEEEKIAEAAKDGKDSDEMMKQSSLDKPPLEKREEAVVEDAKDQLKDEKREKNTRNRTSSGSSSSRVRDTRGGRQWGAFSVLYTRGWRGSETRGRRSGPRSTGKSGISSKSGSYGHTDSENSADEVSGSTESGKEEKRSARSPKPSQKLEKEDRNRDLSRRDEKRGSDYSQSRSEKRAYDGKPSHEAFAPSGEPSRRGRGSFRIRNTTTGGRMEGYGPPSSKSPFSSERNVDDKHQQNAGRQNPPTPTSEKDVSLMQSAPIESTDDKIIAKQQALTAGITGRRNKSPSQQAQQSGNKQETNQVTNVPSQKAQIRKEESRSKRTRSGSRRVCIE